MHRQREFEWIDAHAGVLSRLVGESKDTTERLRFPSAESLW